MYENETYKVLEYDKFEVPMILMCACEEIVDTVAMPRGLIREET